MDVAHKETDKMIEELDKELSKVYSQATKEVEAKADVYFQKFAKKDEIKQKQLANGVITKDQYKTWRKNQLLVGDRWNEMKETLAEDLTHTNQIAADIINGKKPAAYALNHNYGTFLAEKDSKVGTSYVLYDKDTVERLVAKNPDLLPKTKIDIPKDKAWNKKKITSAVTQGVLQGESIPDLSKRLQSVTDMNHNSAVRNARTAMTGAQNAGRTDAFKRAKSKGIEMLQVWCSTLDSRTRHSHVLEHGEKIPVGGKFSNGLRFPGDPTGPGYDVYNCRCTLLAQVKGIDLDVEGLVNQKTGMQFSKWLEEQAAPDSAITSAWAGMKMSNIYNLIKAQNTKDANTFYKELGKLGKPSEVWDKYLTGQLDADELNKFEGILKKYLPKQAPTVTNPYSTMSMSDIIFDSKFKAGTEVKDYLSTVPEVKNYKLSWHAYVKKWADGDITDSKLDELLLGIKKSTVTPAPTTIAKEAQDQLDKLKLKAGKAMTKDEADTYKVNPFHDAKDKATTTNCQTCSFAYEARRQGYDVIALPKDDKLSDIFDLQSKLGKDQANGWINKTTGKAPTALIHQDNQNYFMTKQAFLTDLEKNVGTNGERYIMGVKWKSNGAHSICVDRDEKGVLRIIDNQRGPLEKNTWTAAEYFDEKNIANIRRLYRVDDCVPNAEYFNKILVDASKVKPNLPAKITGSDPNYTKLHKIAHNKNESPSVYYKKWKHGIIDDPDMDDLFGIGKATTTKVNDIDNLKKSLPKSLNTLNANEKDLFNEVYPIVKDEYDIAGIYTPKELWNKYLEGKWKSPEIDDILKKHLAKPVPKPIPTPVPKPTSTIDIDALKTKKVTQVYNEIKDDVGSKDANAFYNELKNIGKKDGLKQGDVWKKYLAGELDADDVAKVEKYLGKYKTATSAPAPKPTPVPAPTPVSTVPELDFDAIKDKKMSAVYNEIKATDTKTANQFYNELKKMGKPSEVWDDYVNGAISAENQKKIEDLLMKKYVKGGTSTVKDTVTKSDDLIKAEEKLKKAEKALKDNVDTSAKWSGIWKDDVMLADYEQKKSTIAAKKIYYQEEIEKLKNLSSDAVIDYSKFGDKETFEKLLKYDDLYDLMNDFDGYGEIHAALKKYGISTGSKDLDDLIKDAKKFKNTDPDVKLELFEKYLNDLNDFEEKGKEYAKYQKAVEKAKKEVQDLTPVGEAYTQARKDAAVWIKNNSDYRKIDPYYDKVARDIKPTRTTRENEGMKHYTWGSMPFNSPLAGFNGDRYTNFVGVNKVDIDVGGYGERIRGLTSLVEKSHYDKDVWVATAQDEITIESFLGVKPGTLRNMTDADAQQFVGVQNEIPQFISAAVQKGGGSYVPGNMTINIYCPEGSEILYILEDGHFGKAEKEMILQRGGTYKLTRIYKDKGAHGRNEWIVDLELHPEYGYDKFQQK